MDPKRELQILAVILLGAFAIRAWNPTQPIVENYVGRQIPTAMVARHLQQSRMFFHPRLDTLPSPNYFVIEPPIYAGVVAGLSTLTGLPIEAVGRLVSALGIVLACWALHGLARPREGVPTSLLAVAIFALFPVTIRYGRAFQPDALMLGLAMAGIRSWDQLLREDGRPWIFAAWFVLAIGLSMKVISAYLLLPILIPLIETRRYVLARILLATLLPALAWYGWAYWLVSQTRWGSQAQAQSFAIWKSALFSTALLSSPKLTSLVRFATIRSFTPIGSVMGVMGWMSRSRVDRFWTLWALGLAATFLLVAGKIHHEYYWMAVAPLLAVGFARNLFAFARGRKWLWFGGFAAAFLATSVALSLSTFQTPREWRTIEQMGQIVRKERGIRQIIATEAVIYYSGRPGFRLEFDPESVSRAAEEFVGLVPSGSSKFGEPGAPKNPRDAAGLVDLYLFGQNEVFVVGLDSDDPREVALRETLRKDRRGRLLEWPGIGWIWEATSNGRLNPR